MPYLLMTRAYDYNDEYYTEQEGGYPELLFTDDQYLEALETLDTHRQAEWLSCTPLDIYYYEQPLSDFSSSDLDEEALAAGISAILGQQLNAQEILALEFETLSLSVEQERLIGLLFDQVGHSYLEFVHSYRGG